MYVGFAKTAATWRVWGSCLAKEGYVSTFWRVVALRNLKDDRRDVPAAGPAGLDSQEPAARETCLDVFGCVDRSSLLNIPWNLQAQ